MAEFWDTACCNITKKPQPNPDLHNKFKSKNLQPVSNQTPLACDLSAIEDDELKQHKSNSENVLTSIRDVQELGDGYAFRLPTKTELIEQAGSFIARERQCCPFFNFNLEVTPDHGPVWLKVTGDHRVKEFVKKNMVTQLETGAT